MQVVSTVRLTRLKPLVSRQQTSFYESDFWFADSTAFTVFSLPLVQGNARTALVERDGVVLSETMARKYFGSTNPMGQALKIGNKATLHVTGVLRDLPANSHLNIGFLANYGNANDLVGYDVTIVAIVIASPVAWYGMNQWLTDFAYRIDIAWWVFALAGLSALGIALLTVSYQSVRTALMNPVESLRTE